MAVEDINGDDNNEKLSLPGDELEEFFSFESPLCVPQDSLDDIDWFPNFTDEIISLDGFSLTSQRDEISYKASEDSCSTAWKNSDKRRGVGDEETHDDDNIIGFAKKKARSKRGSGGKRGFWYAKELEAMDHSEKWDEDEEWDDIKEKRKCIHCLSEKTPQWRMGPLGPKTLCNACGVRYKSGRLVPEYRPAASPSFDSRKHSNYHKQILRRRGI